MTNCPKCGRPVGGRARVCGYCGESLVSDYFQRAGAGAPGLAEAEEAPLSGGAVAAVTLGVFAGAALVAALGFHLAVLFGFGRWETLTLDAAWWARTVLMSLLPPVYLGRLLALRGRGGLLAVEYGWLFLAAGGLCFTVLCYVNRGLRPFYGVTALPYLLVAGCSLGVAAQSARVLGRQNPPKGAIRP